MTTPFSAVYKYIVRELSPAEQHSEEAPITIVCEPSGSSLSEGGRAVTSMRLFPGTTPDEANAIAATLQAKVKRLCHVGASGDAAA